MSDLKEIVESARTISIDLDGVLMKPFLGKVWFPFHKKRPHTPKIWDPFENDFRSVIQHFRPAFEDSREVLAQWKNEGKTLYLVTARYKNIIPVTGAWLDKNNFTPLFTKLVFNLEGDIPSEFKVKAIKELNVDLHIDDDTLTISALSKEHPSKKFICLNFKDRSAPKDEKDLGGNVTLINSWGAFIN